jgi:hypothetical protein
LACPPWRNNLFQFFERPLDGGVATRSQLAERIYGLVVNELGFGQALVLWASVALIAVAFLLERRRPIQGSILLVLLGAGAQIAVFFIDPSNRHMGARYLLPIYPLWIVLLANATVTCVDWIASTLWQTNGRSLATLMTEISRPRLALGGLAMLVPIGFMTIYLGYAGNDLRLYYQTPREQFKETAQYINDHLLPGEPILINSEHYGYVGVLEYYPRQMGYSNRVLRNIYAVEQVESLCSDNQRAWYWTRQVNQRVRQHPAVMWLETNGDCSHSDQFTGFLVCSCGPTPEAIAATIQNPQGASPLQLANAYRTEGDWDKATELYEQLIRDEQDVTQAVQGLRMIGLMNRNRALELAAVMEQWQAEPQNPELGKTLATVIKRYLDDNPDVLMAMLNSGNNLLDHSSFEEGNAFRIPEKSPSQHVKLQRDTTVARTGNASLQSIGTSLDYHGGWYARVPVEGNAPYLFAGYARSEDEGGLQGRLFYWENDGSKLLGSTRFEGAIEDWTFYWGVAMVAPEQQRLNLRPALFEGNGSIWVDDVVLINLVEAIESTATLTTTAELTGAD